jgi:uncharacterized protein (DUF2147 family)
MKKSITLSGIFFLLCSSLAMAADDTPVGLWKSIDDDTGQPKALIRISETNGTFSGVIEKVYRAPNEEQNPLCVQCSGELKDQPVNGMTILTGLQKDGEEYTGGEILDPGNGKTYKSKLVVEDNGQKLKVRGYIGIPALGRTQTWLREQ